MFCHVYHEGLGAKGANNVCSLIVKTLSMMGVLVDGERVIAPITQRYFVRRDLRLQKDISIVGQMLEERQQVKVLPLGGGVVRVFHARDFDSCCMEALTNNRYAFYKSVED